MTAVPTTSESDRNGPKKVRIAREPTSRTISGRRTSISSSSPKPAVKSSLSSSTTSRPTGTTSTTTARSAPISKPTGAVADAKKRLSSVAGSPSASKPAASARTIGHSSAPSKEVDELKAKLADSETRVEELKKEIESSQEKLLELGKQVENEAVEVASTQETIRAEHNAMVESLRAKHKADVEELQEQLASAELAKAEAQESSSKALEAASAKRFVIVPHNLGHERGSNVVDGS